MGIPDCADLFRVFLEVTPTQRALYNCDKMASFLSDPTIALELGASATGAMRNRALEEELLRLFDLMRTRLLRYAVSFGISVQDGEDIVQETFLALWHHLNRNRPTENLYGWLFRVTHNLALKQRMRAGVVTVEPNPDGFEMRDPGLNPEESVLFGEKHARLRSLVGALPIEDQMCLRLRAEGLRYREIAEIVGISLGGVSASLSRSFARLERGEAR